MDGVVGSLQDTDPRAPALTATMISTRNSAPVGVRDQYLWETTNAVVINIRFLRWTLA